MPVRDDGATVRQIARALLRHRQPMNRWNIPPALEAQVLERDRRCVYCRLDFAQPARRRGDRPSWEHIVNDESRVNLANIARCCLSCNASKGARRLSVWLHSRYCQRRGIGPETVAPVVQMARQASEEPTAGDG